MRRRGVDPFLVVAAAAPWIAIFGAVWWWS